MSIIINYHKQFSKEINDYIIVLSKFSELKTLNGLPIDTNLLSRSKEIEKILNERKFYQSYVKSNLSNSLYNVKIFLIKAPKKENCIELGAKIYNQYDSKSPSNLNIIFTTNLLRTYNINCTEIIFGLFLRSYDFIEGACGGMCLCATCHCYILSENNNILNKENEEEGMLDQLFSVKENSRLACQIPLTKELDNIIIQIATAD